MRHRLAHRVGRSSQATTAAVDKSPRRLTHENPDAPLAPRVAPPCADVLPSLERGDHDD